MDKEEALNRVMQLLHEINEVITQQKKKRWFRCHGRMILILRV